MKRRTKEPKAEIRVRIAPMQIVRDKALQQGYEEGYAAAKREATVTLTPYQTACVEACKAMSQALSAMAQAVSEGLLPR